MQYLALDQSPLRCGFAHAGPQSARPAWGVFPILQKHPEASFRDWLQSMVTCIGVCKVIYEGPFVGARTNPQDIIRICAMPAIIKLVAYDCDVPCVEAPMRSWRKHFLGICAAPKEIKKHKRRQWLKDEAMRACVERDWFVTKDDEADALGILDWALARDFPDYGRDTSALFREMKGAAA